MYTEYVYQFEIAAVILLVAIIAAITLTLRHTRQTKTPKPERQVTVRREDRVRLVKVDVRSMATVPGTLSFYMGKNTPDRRDYIMENLI